ncbi:MAG: DUF4214 domain-containing protein [Pseudomonadota bacterium]
MYEVTEAAVSAALTASPSEALTTETIDLILSLVAGGGDNNVQIDQVAPGANGVVTVPEGAEIVFVQTSDTEMTPLSVSEDAPVVIFQGKGGVSATIGAGGPAGGEPGASSVDAMVDISAGNATVVSGYGVTGRVVIGSAGSDLIKFSDSANSHVTLGGGDTVVSGGGDDTIVAGFGNTTVVGGSGFEVLQLKGSAADYTVSVANGHAIVTNKANNFSTDTINLQYVELDNGKGMVFAKNTLEASVTMLFQATFGRMADADGLGYWFDLAKSGVSLDTMAQGFINSAEYQANFASQSNNAFVAKLYMNTFGRVASAGEISFWEGHLNAGTVSRAAVVSDFAEVAGQFIAGNIVTETTVVGTVIIVPGTFG